MQWLHERKADILTLRDLRVILAVVRASVKAANWWQS